MKRRDFITLLGGAAAWPLAARAQQPALPVIGYLSAGSPQTELGAQQLGAFRRGLSELGYAEGRNVAIEYRWFGTRNDQLPAMAADVVGRRVAVIVVTGGSEGARAVRAATMTIPIVFITGVDPVASGLVTSLNRPDGNLTGVTTLTIELGPKRLELLRETIPTAGVFGLLVNPNNPGTEAQIGEMQAAASTLGVELHILHARAEQDFDTVFASMVRQKVAGLVITADLFFLELSAQLARVALRYNVPAIFQYREFAAAGGFMSYGSYFSEAYRTMGGYVGRILKGDKPADLPVQRSSKVELIINLKTAKALGITVPLTLRGRADEIIE
jgi:putative ABC transport system substrate-binding protein